MKSFIVGIISFFIGIIVAIGSIFLVLKFVPIKSFTDMAGVKAEDVMSDKIYSKSAIDALMGISSYTMNDVKVLKDAVLDFANDEQIKQYVTVDEAAFGALTFGNLSSGIADCIRIKDINDMYLVDVLSASGNEQIYSIIRDATGIQQNNQIKVGHLRQFDIDNIHMSSVIAVNGNERIYDMLRDGTGKVSNDQIKVSDLANFNVDEMYLVNIIPVSGNEMTYNIIRNGTGKATNEEIKVKHLEDFDVDDIYLVEIFAEAGNERIYDILRSGTGKTSNDQIKVRDLANFNVEEMYLVDILPVENNEQVYSIIRDATGVSQNNQIKIKHLKQFSVENICLYTILDETGNEIIYDILRDGTGVTSNTQIKISDLANFDVNNVYVSELFSVQGNEKIYDIIRDGTGVQTNAEIKVGDLINFNISNIKLSTVLTQGEINSNVILKAVYGDGTLTLGGLSDRINNTPIQEVYNVECFTDDVNLTSGISAKYSKNADGSYTLDSTGEYYISKEAGAWFFMFYYAEGRSADGDALKYRPSNYTMGGMEEIVDEINDHIEDATIKQLIDIGILTNPHGDYSALIYGKTLNEVLRSITSIS